MDNSLLKQFETDIKTKSKEMEAVRKKLTAENEAVLKDLFKRFFKMFPEVPGVTWVQYTPGFNDGDPCEFIMGEAYLLAEIKEDEDNDIGYEDELSIKGKDYGTYNCGIDDKKLDKAFNVLSGFIQDSADTLENMYGSDQRITFLSDGTVDKDEYDCGH